MPVKAKIPKAPAPSTAATDTAVRHQVYLERLGSDAALKATIQAVHILDEAERLLAEYGEVTELSAAKLKALLAESTSAQLDVMTTAIDQVSGVLAELSDYESQFTVKSLQKMAKRVKILSLKAGEAYKEALSTPLPATGKLLDPFLENWSTTQVEAVNSVIGKGYTQGWTNDQITRALRGTKAANYADGIVPNIGRNAEAVVRTSIQHVANTSRMTTWAKNSDVVVGYRIVATLDGRTTPICRSLDGRVYKLGEGPQPPFHVRCRTTTVAVLKDEFDFLSEGETRASKSGPVDAEQTYYSWLKDQPAAFQDDVIGPTRAKLLRDGGLTADEFSRLNLNRNFEPLTLDQMRKKEPLAFQRAGL